jgi:ArsR family transcriptional regulator, arsenate/arsenite/antimonite-responsive transcriptional repressor / arsenate reductase (thioredoxin)
MDITVSSPELPDFLKLLAHELRWKILALLARSDFCVAEIVRFLNQPQNLVSYHLRKLRDQHLVTERRSSADARDIYYSLDLATMRSLYLATGEALHPILGSWEVKRDGESWSLPTPPVRVLFLCTENSARSQLAEELLRQLSQGQVEVQSAGSKPGGVHPLALRIMQDMGMNIQGLRSKHLDEFRGQAFDYVVTVCDRVREECLAFPGDAQYIHWSIADPAAVQGSAEERLHVFEQTAQQLEARIRALLTRIERAHVASA